MANSTDVPDPSETIEELLAAYHEEVLNALDLTTIYRYTLAESLEEELSPSIANTLLSKDPLTQRRKRNLFVETTATTERREEYCAELDDGRSALELFAQELENIEEILDKLPVCSAREHSLEKLLIVWEVYDTLLERYERLLEQRQQ